MSEDSFFNYLTYEKRYSPNTLKAYRNDLGQFGLFLRLAYDHGEVSSATHIQIRSWIVALIEEGVSNASINRKISCLKAFFKYLKRNGVISANPMVKVVAPKTGSRLPVFVEEKNMQALFDKDLFAADFPGQRDALLIELLYNTGMRLSELINLKEAQVDFYNRQLKVLGKRNKERIIPMNEALADMISRYISFKKDAFPGIQNAELLVKDDGVKMYEKFVYRIVNRYLGLVTTLKKKSPHVLRHTFATHMLNKGADLGAIKEILGHSSLAATQLYTHNSIEKLKDVHKKAHPKG
jgi:integrase/recombinase XerC